MIWIEEKPRGAPLRRITGARPVCIVVTSFSLAIATLLGCAPISADAVLPTVNCDVSAPELKAPFTGKSIRLSFPSVDLRVLLGIIADFSGRKLSLDSAITGIGAQANLSGPWDEVLATVAQRHQLRVRVTDEQIVVCRRR